MKTGNKNKSDKTLELLAEVTSKSPNNEKIKNYVKLLNIKYDRDLNQQMVNIMLYMSKKNAKGTNYEPSL